MFTHLHTHTEYSLLDGLSRIPQLVQKAAQLGMDSLAITDHGALYGAVDFYTACVEAGIKPIIGCEIYLASGGSRFNKTGVEKSPFHLTVLAKNEKGYKNLIKLVTRAHLEGFYYKPRADRELIEEHHEGLIILSGCPTAEIPQLLVQGRYEEAKQTALWYKGLLGEDFFLEIQRHEHVPELPTINEGITRLSEETGIPIVATNDVHYVERADAPLQDVLICIHTNTNIYDENRLRMEDDSYYLKSAEEMRELFRALQVV